MQSHYTEVAQGGISSRIIHTLYKVILRIARNLLGTRENIKIESHPFYHIICDWFSWGSRKKKFKKIFGVFVTFFLCNFLMRTQGIFKNNSNLFFGHENMKKLPSKVAHNWSKSFFSVLPTRPKPAQLLVCFPKKCLPARLLYNDFAHMYD